MKVSPSLISWFQLATPDTPCLGHVTGSKFWRKEQGSLCCKACLGDHEATVAPCSKFHAQIWHLHQLCCDACPYLLLQDAAADVSQISWPCGANKCMFWLMYTIAYVAYKTAYIVISNMCLLLHYDLCTACFFAMLIGLVCAVPVLLAGDAYRHSACQSTACCVGQGGVRPTIGKCCTLHVTLTECCSQEESGGEEDTQRG